MYDIEKCMVVNDVKSIYIENFRSIRDSWKKKGYTRNLE